MDQDLIAAAGKDDLARISALLKRGANVNARDAQGRTPVMAATYARHANAVEALIRAGADVNARDEMLNNPLLYAGAEGMLDILKLANAAGADPRLTNRYGGTALIPAAERGHVDVVDWLLANTKVEVNHVNRLGWTALLEAIVLSDGGPRHQRIVASHPPRRRCQHPRPPGPNAAPPCAIARVCGDRLAARSRRRASLACNFSKAGLTETGDAFALLWLTPL